jgi:hypothetical protein
MKLVVILVRHRREAGGRQRRAVWGRTARKTMPGVAALLLVAQDVVTYINHPPLSAGLFRRFGGDAIIFFLKQKNFPAFPLG